IKKELNTENDENKDLLQSKLFELDQIHKLREKQYNLIESVQKPSLKDVQDQKKIFEDFLATMKIAPTEEKGIFLKGLKNCIEFCKNEIQEIDDKLTCYEFLNKNMLDQAFFDMGKMISDFHKPVAILEEIKHGNFAENLAFQASKL